MSDIIVTRQQLEAWAAALKGSLRAVYLQDGPTQTVALSCEQALEDMTDMLADPEAEIEDDPQTYDPDAPEDSDWNGPDGNVCEGKDQDTWYH